MRVLFYTHPFFLEPALEFAREMSRRCEFHLMLEVTPRSQGSMLALTSSGIPAGVIDADPILLSRVPDQVRGYWTEVRTFRLAVYDNARTLHPATIPASRRVIDAIDRLEPDVIHLDDGSLRLAMGLPWLPRITLMNVHDPVPHSGDANRRIELGRRLVSRRVDRYRLFSEAFRAAFAARSGIAATRLEVAPLGVYDVARAWLDRPELPQPRTVLFAGRIAPYKGLDVLYAAAPRVAEQVADVRFVIAGRSVDGYAPPRPPALVNGGRIEVIDRFIPAEDLARLHSAATLVACPYLDATQSGVILTAFAFGRPVVASSVGGLPEYVDNGQTGLLVPPGDPEALADAIVRVLTDPPLRQRLELAVGGVRRGRLGWPQIADQLLDSYQAAPVHRPAPGPGGG
jgi:glycosyltransferase involved in cell wall biosynthesis